MPWCGSPLDQQFAARQDFTADGRRRRRRKSGNAERGKVFRHLLQIRVRKKLQEIVHRRVFAPAVRERHELIVEIAGGLARKPREIDVAGALALRAMTGRAGQHARSHRIGRAFLTLRDVERQHGKEGRCEQTQPHRNPRFE